MTINNLCPVCGQQMYQVGDTWYCLSCETEKADNLTDQGQNDPAASDEGAHKCGLYLQETYLCAQAETDFCQRECVYRMFLTRNEKGESNCVNRSNNSH